MNGRLRRVVRLARGAVSLFAMLLFLGLVSLSFAGYLAATGRSLWLLKAIAGRIGELAAGQRTEKITIDARVVTDPGTLVGSATLTLHSLDTGRRRFYFLLNDGLHIRNVRVGGGDVVPGVSPVAYQLALLTIVDVGAPLAQDATLELTFDYDGVPSGSLFDSTSPIDAQGVVLEPDALWYPTDGQSFFTADVSVSLPADLTLVHNAASAARIERGAEQRVHWTTDRPVAGLSLIAGRYTPSTTDVDGISYRVLLPSDVRLDASRIAATMAEANRVLVARYGPPGLKQVTLFVNPDLGRAFNDGTGLVGLSPRYFRAGDYGFGIIAHELAHNWWGGTVAEKWLSPGTGGEWLVEGFAEFSSLMAAEAVYGPNALTRRLATEFFDPGRHTVVADMSVLDNLLGAPTVRNTIYRKGAYVAFMLRQTLGDDVYFRGLREFIERFRYRQATDHDLQHVLEEVSGHDLGTYFADWVRSTRLADLSLDSTGDAQLTVGNLGTAGIPGDIALWTFAKRGGEPIRTIVHVGDQLALAPDAEYAVLDPMLSWADMQRENNRYPRRSDPVYVAISGRGDRAVTRGEALPWVRTAVTTDAGGGGNHHTWDFNRGLAMPPAWSLDGTHIIVSSDDADSPPPAIVTLATQGAQRTLGRGWSPAPGADGAVYAASGSRIVRIATDGSTATVVQRAGESVETPLSSPDGQQLAYTAAHGHHLDLRVVRWNDQTDRVVLSTNRDGMTVRWDPSGTRLYAIAGGSWDWQIWDVPLGAEPVRVLAQGASVITDLGVSPDGASVAFTASPSLDYPTNRRQLYVLQVDDRTVRNIDVAGFDLSRLAWADADTVLVVARPSAPGTAWILPERRTLKRVSVADGVVEDMAPDVGSADR